ncbi:MAG TPA: MBL fold metallo-hydrolase [Pedococcus sp.]|jgi:L-ascorbate metabolism protein UlaG (beta-lactamase superfamily)|nr:MBL fold metallo-hydrolase [Pedococcus sp.]
MVITHLGHACVLVETDDARLLIDPGTMSRLEGIEELTAVLVTHQHPDHIDLGRLAPLLAASPQARLVVDPDTVDAVAAVEGLARVEVCRPGERLTFAGTTVDVLGGRHASVYGDVPGCTNNCYAVDGGAFLHPGDSFHVPDLAIDVLAVAIDGPWLKLAEAVDYVHAVAPRVAVPIHEGEAVDPGKYAGMLGAFAPLAAVRQLAIGEPNAL